MTRLCLISALLFGSAAVTLPSDFPAVATRSDAMPSGKHRPKPLPRASRSVSERLPLVKAMLSPRTVPHRHPQPAGDVSEPWQTVAVTMYCYTGSRNAAGKWPTVGTAAGNAWALGTRLEVEGVGVVTIEDRSAPGATDVDLYGGTDAGCEARAAEWGRRYLRVREAA